MYVQTRGPLSKTPIQMAFDVAGLEGVLMMERGGGGFGFVDSLSHHRSIPLLFVLSSAPLCGSSGVEASHVRRPNLWKIA